MRVVVADDSLLVREGIARVLEACGFEVVGLADDADALLRLVRESAPDVAVVDIRMPPTYTDEGLRAVALLRREHGDRLGLVVLSQFLDAGFAQQIITDISGGSGYLLKERVADPRVFADAISRVARGEVVVDPEIVARLLRRRERDPLSDLTDRESEVIALLAEGRSNQAISDRLGIAGKTVETHVNAIFSKLGLEQGADDNRRVLAVLTYLRGRTTTP